jgi:uncharacterized Zn-binding protein involved in type VI secretion
MAGACRAGVDTAGGLIASGSGSVFINGSPAVRIGDPVVGHGLIPHTAPTMATGSATVMIDGIPACRAGDIATCGHAATGSGDVNIG